MPVWAEATVAWCFENLDGHQRWPKTEDTVASLEEKVNDIVLEILDVKAEDIVPTAMFVDNLNATSIDLVEILTAFQNTFVVNIE